jgi:hypothetical protein
LVPMTTSTVETFDDHTPAAAGSDHQWRSDDHDVHCTAMPEARTSKRCKSDDLQQQQSIGSSKMVEIKFSPELKELVASCLQRDPKKR